MRRVNRGRDTERERERERERGGGGGGGGGGGERVVGEELLLKMYCSLRKRILEH